MLWVIRVKKGVYKVSILRLWAFYSRGPESSIVDLAWGSLSQSEPLYKDSIIKVCRLRISYAGSQNLRKAEGSIRDPESIDKLAVWGCFVA